LAKCDKLRVLVADCEPVIADTLSIILNWRGYESLSVSTYSRAMEVLEVFQPHLLISCLKLGGVKFPLDVSDRFPDCKIIVISGLLDAFLQDLGYVPKKGSRLVWWRKPVHPQDIFQKAEELLFPGDVYTA
jgi:two-component SAPR family response regulator